MAANRAKGGARAPFERHRVRAGAPLVQRKMLSHTRCGSRLSRGRQDGAWAARRKLPEVWAQRGWVGASGTDADGEAGKAEISQNTPHIQQTGKGSFDLVVKVYKG